MNKWFLLMVGLLFPLISSAYSDFKTGDGHQTSSKQIVDPMEKTNRKLYQFDKQLDQHVLKPAAKLYDHFLPDWLAHGIHNMLHNIGDVWVLANDLLQLDISHAGETTARLLVNTTVGVGGFFDIAAKQQVPGHKNDLGLTLMRWGATHPFYVVLPFFGPSSSVGMMDDVFYWRFNPYHYLMKRNVQEQREWLAVQAVDTRVQNLPNDHLFDGAFDEYLMVRDAYWQNRMHQLDQLKHGNDSKAI